MAQRLHWKSLVPGIAAVLGLIGVSAVVLVYGSVGRIRGDTIRLHVLTDQARGVMRGTDVWLEGQRVGIVERISFRDPGTDTLERVVITMDVRARDAGQIRRDSDVRVRAGANVMGPIVVYLSAGTPASAAVRDGDTLVAAPQSDLQNAMQRLGDAAADLGPLAADAKRLVVQARSGSGTVGAALQERGGPEVARLRANVARLGGSFGGTAESRSRLLATAHHALARVDSIRTLLASDRSSLGRFRRDSTLATTIAGVRDELAAVRERLAGTDGTIPRFGADSAIALAVANAQREMGLLFDDVRKRPLRYIAF